MRMASLAQQLRDAFALDPQSKWALSVWLARYELELVGQLSPKAKVRGNPCAGLSASELLNNGVDIVLLGLWTVLHGVVDLAPWAGDELVKRIVEEEAVELRPIHVHHVAVGELDMPWSAAGQRARCFHQVKPLLDAVEKPLGYA